MATDEQIHYMLTSYDNLDEPEPVWNRPECIYGLTISFMIAATLCVGLRLYTRVKQGCVGWDDYTLIATRIAILGCSIAFINSVSNGLGQHFSTLPTSTMIAFQKDFYASLVTYIVATALVKLCFLSQYFRIFPAGTQTRLVCWIVLVASAMWGIAFFILAVLPCVPVYAFFDWSVPAKCWGYGSRNADEMFATFAAHSTLNSFLDLVVLCIPLPMYLNKQTTSWKQRASIATMFSFGLFVFGISIWRLYSIVEHRAATWPVVDPTWYAPSALVLAVVEVDMASMCASIQVFWPMVQESWGKIFITQEVEVVHENRLSGETQLGSGSSGDEDRGCGRAGGKHVRLGSDASGKTLELMELGRQGIGRDGGSPHLHAVPRGHYEDGLGGDGGGNGPAGAARWDIAAKPTSEAQVTSQGPRGFVKERERYHVSHSPSQSLSRSSPSSTPPHSGSGRLTKNGARYSPEQEALDKETAVNFGNGGGGGASGERGRIGRRASKGLGFKEDLDEPQMTWLSSQRSWPHLLQRGDREHPTPRWLV